MLSHNVSELVQAPVGTTQALVIDEPRPDLGPELRMSAPLRGRGRLHRIPRGILVQCELGTTVLLECSRCLEPFTQELAVRFAEEFQVPLPAADEAEAESEAF